jgi:hypothetical protein
MDAELRKEETSAGADRIAKLTISPGTTTSKEAI